MTRAEQHKAVDPACDATDEDLAADSRDRATRALLRVPALRRLWEARLTGAVADALATLVLLLLAVQAAVTVPAGGGPDDLLFGGGYRAVALAVTLALAVRLVVAPLVGILLLGPVTALVAPDGPLDRRWTMIGADLLRAAVLIVAPLWVDWLPSSAFVYVLVTLFVLGVADRVWTVTKDTAAPALLPEPPPEGAAVRPLPDHHEALRRLWQRSAGLALPAAAAVLLASALLSNLLATGLDWFATHQAALGSYVAAGFFAASVSVLYFLRLPDARTPRPRSPLEGLRRPSAGTAPDRGRTGAVPALVLGSAAVAVGLAAALALAVLHAGDLGGGPAYVGLLALALSGGAVAGTRGAPAVLPALSRRRLLALAVTVAGLGLLAVGLVSDAATVLLCALVAGLAGGVALHTGQVLLDLETEEFRRPRLAQHLHAVLRIAVAVAVVAGPLVAALIGPQRVERGDFVIDHGGAAFTLALVGALLLPVAALLLRSTDDRRGEPLLRDVRGAVRDVEPAQAPAEHGFFVAVEGGDGAGKTTQVEALAEWIRGKGHEVIVTREPGATPVGQRLRAILLDVSSAGLSHRAEALLYAADRAEHVDSVIRPALERGAVVISDRYIDSSVAYQGAGRDLSPTEIARMSRWATDGLVPHLTVLLDVTPETARERFTEAPDRLESEPSEFHQRVRGGFMALAAADPTRYLIVDAGQDPESVTTAARHRLDQMLPLSEAERTAREEARRKAEEEARRRAEEERQRKEEEERRERERQAELARLKAEEEERRRQEEAERRRREEEEARRREEEEARRRAEEEQRRAEEARKAAEEERRRREAEERLRREEEERRRREAEEEARLRAQAEERRQEKQRKAEQALLRAEEARQATDVAKEAVSGRPDTPDTPRTSENPGIGDGSDTVQLPQAKGVSPDEETRMMPRVAESAETAGPAGPAEASGDVAETAPLPEVTEEEAAAGRRQRPDWAEKTPLDDVPTLADELLGPHEYDAPEQPDERRDDDGNSSAKGTDRGGRRR